MVRRWHLSSIIFLLRSSTNWMVYLSPLQIGEPRLIHMCSLVNDHGRTDLPSSIHKGKNSTCLPLLPWYLPVSCCTVVSIYLADCKTMLNSCLLSIFDQKTGCLNIPAQQWSYFSNHCSMLVGFAAKFFRQIRTFLNYARVSYRKPVVSSKTVWFPWNKICYTKRCVIFWITYW